MKRLSAALSNLTRPWFNSHWYPWVAGGGRKGIWLNFLPCTSKSPTMVPPSLVGTSEPLNKAVNDVKLSTTSSLDRFVHVKDRISRILRIVAGEFVLLHWRQSTVQNHTGVTYHATCLSVTGDHRQGLFSNNSKEYFSTICTTYIGFCI